MDDDYFSNVPKLKGLKSQGKNDFLPFLNLAASCNFSLRVCHLEPRKTPSTIKMCKTNVI